MKKSKNTKKAAIGKAKASKSLTKSVKKVTVTKAKKAATVKTVSKKTKKPVVTKAAKITAKKTIAKKTPKKKAVTKAAKAITVKSAAKVTKKVVAAKTNVVKNVTKAAKAITVKSAAKVTKKVAAAKTSAVKSTVKESPKAKESKSSSNSTFAKTTKPVAPLRDRPLSPHLSIYRPQITSVLSILHRATGVALYIGAFVLAEFIICLGYGEKCFTAWVDFFKTPVGTFMLFGWIFCLYYHLFNGIRHLMWDIGKGFAMPNVNTSGVVVLFVSLTLTFTTFFITHPETLEMIKQWM